MGNKLDIMSNVNLSRTVYTTNQELYIHYSKNKDYYIAKTEYVKMSSDCNQIDGIKFILPSNSTITIIKFEIQNNELRLLAKIQSNSYHNNTSNIWKYNDLLVNVMSFFQLKNNHLIS